LTAGVPLRELMASGLLGPGCDALDDADDMAERNGTEAADAARNVRRFRVSMVVA